MTSRSRPHPSAPATSPPMTPPASPPVIASTAPPNPTTINGHATSTPSAPFMVSTVTPFGGFQYGT